VICQLAPLTPAQLDALVAFIRERQCDALEFY
jgi:hypothetical protein